MFCPSTDGESQKIPSALRLSFWSVQLGTDLGLGFTHLHLIRSESPRVVRKVCLEATRHVGPTCIATRKEIVSAARAVMPCTFCHVVYVACDGQLLQWTVGSGGEEE